MVPHRALKAKIAENCKKNPIFEATTIAMIAITTRSSIRVNFPFFRQLQRFIVVLPCSPKSCHPSATGLGSFGPNAQKLRVLFGGPALRCSVRLRRTHTFEKGIVDIFPKSCHPSSFAEAAEDKSGLSSTALARRMILFGGPAL